MSNQQENAQNELAPQEAQAVQEDVEITTFADNLAVIPKHVPGEALMPSFGATQFTDAMVHSVVSFLRRPQLLQSFYWDPMSGNSMNSDLLMSMPNDKASTPGLLIPSQVFHTMQLRKLDGFAGIRATVVLKLQVNSQPFNAGRLLMAAVPMPTLLHSRAKYVAMTIGNLQNVNHIQMDICKQTEVELRVPFISPYNCYDLSTGNFDWAQLYIKVYGPLNTTTTTAKLECLLWYHFEDIELGFPTSAQLKSYNKSIIVQQSGTVTPKITNFFNTAFAVPMGGEEVYEYECQHFGKAVITWSCAQLPLSSKPYRIVIRFNNVDHTIITFGGNGQANFILENTTLFTIYNETNIVTSKFYVNIEVWQDIVIETKVDMSGFKLPLKAATLSVDTSKPLWVTMVGPDDQPVGENFQPLSVPQQQSGKVSKRPTGKSRVPPKEASSKTVAVQRAKESDGVFATAVKSFGNRAANVVNGIASAIGAVGNLFGWSKPQLSHSGNTVVIRPGEYFCNDGGIDHSHVLSLDVMNNVDIYPNLTGTDLDECDFEFLKRIPNLFTYFNYDDSTWTSGNCSEILAQWFVTPNYNQLNSVKMDYPYIYDDKQYLPTSLAYVCSPFAYWTGSIIYTFRFVKTDFHSGRIEFSFHPFQNHFVNKLNLANVDPDQIDRFDLAYRVVVDLRCNSEVSIAVPYVSPQPWKTLEYNKDKFDPLIDSSNYNGGRYINEKNYLNYTTGLFVVRKLTPLILNSSVVSKSICCLVEVRAGDDFRVSCPTHNVYFPYSFPKVDQGTIVPKQQAGIVFATPGTQDTRTSCIEGLIPPSITNNQSDIEQPDMQMFTAGEIFRNFRQFTRRFNFTKSQASARGTLYQYTAGAYVSGTSGPRKVATLDGNVAASTILQPDDFIVAPTLPIWTAYFNYPTTAGGTRNTWLYCFRPDKLPTPISFVGSMFCFYRGGMRFKVTAIEDRTSTMLEGCLIAARLVNNWGFDDLDISKNIDDVNQSYVYPTIPKYLSPTAYEQQPQKGFAEFQIPYYSPTLQSCAWNQQGYTLYDRPLPWLEVEVSKADYSNYSLHFATAGSDDLDFGLYIGPPPVLTMEFVRLGIQLFKSDTTTNSISINYRKFCMDRVAYADPCYELNGVFSSWPTIADAREWSVNKKYPTASGLNENDYDAWIKFFGSDQWQSMKDQNGKPYEMDFKNLILSFTPPPFKFDLNTNKGSSLQIGLPAGSSSA